MVVRVNSDFFDNAKTTLSYDKIPSYRNHFPVWNRLVPAGVHFSLQCRLVKIVDGKAFLLFSEMVKVILITALWTGMEG